MHSLPSGNSDTLVLSALANGLDGDSTRDEVTVVDSDGDTCGGRVPSRPVGKNHVVKEKKKETIMMKKARIAKETLAEIKKRKKGFDQRNDILLFSNGPVGSQSQYAKVVLLFAGESSLESLKKTPKQGKPRGLRKNVI